MQPQVADDFLDGVIDHERRLHTAEQSITNDAIPLGSMIEWPLASNLLPANWRVADGSLVDRGTYANLFAIYGTTFGVGDGATTFGLPIINSAHASPVWTTFSSLGIFTGGYSDYGSGFAPCSLWKDTAGIVTLRGLAKFSTPGSYAPSGVIATLPAEYRPNAGHDIFFVGGSSTTDHGFRMDVATGGAVTWTVTAPIGNWDGSFMSIAGLRFDSGSVSSGMVASTAPPYMAIKAA